ncbi:MAG: bifunctional [glutamate--ammonia ligase]-adenylyl-L-tyrosine phosphorylase/[glutamate--ammonia-ligase] adenylyltransferase, partial [Gallionellaceae bacterium]|nr:bifunctional [glutamate--ammonia ligase]-adenylyl-L-tyrosine phosphorylase/[glutamate--ammonia-ligase] adenylyltransferase [Gallionellaceae bacterium]
MELPQFSRFYRRHAGRFDDVLALWPQGIPSRAELDAATIALQQHGAALPAALRRVRNALMLRLIEADLGGAPLEAICIGISDLAESVVAAGLHAAHAELQPRFGTPRTASGEAAQFLVVGMGKLGGRELNVSSDIDLVFVYDDDGETDGSAPLSNREYFGRVVRALVPLLSDVTGDGFVFRVDTRLRPNGDSGPPVVSLAMLEEYFLVQGREWERFAWLKSRVVSPLDTPQAARAAQGLAAVVEPFVWRRYLDFGMLEALRALHRQIRAEATKRAAARPDKANDVKLGRGGIREIEFTVQLLQVVRGGRMPQIRERATLPALQRLVAHGLLQAVAAERLAASYRFLRRLEHRIQYLDDAQTHSMPSEDADLHALAWAMGFVDDAAQQRAGCPKGCKLLRELDNVREFVASEFDALLHNGPQCTGCSKPPESMDAVRHRLAKAGLAHDATVARLKALETSPRYAALSDTGRLRLLRVLDRVIGMAAERPAAEVCLARIIDLLEAIGRRETYLAFFAEQPAALARLCNVLETSAWAADYIKRHPAVVDELISPPSERFNAADYRLDLLQHHAQLTERGRWDAGEGMDLLRQGFHAEMFRTLSRDLAGLIKVEQVADELSALADATVQLALEWCWKELPQRHREQPAFAVIAYGKLGGKELGYGSDLDIVFLYDDSADNAQDVYAAFARKLVWWLTAHTAAGRLFEIDTRLRPNGNAGLLVTSVEAFDGYQRGRGSNTAWTWEHQALTRARCCAGDLAIGARFEAIRTAVLTTRRDADALRTEILAMRQKVADGHPNHSGLFDVKHDPGGMVDVEFAVQFLVLAHAADYPQLTADLGNIALLGMAEALGLL